MGKIATEEAIIGLIAILDNDLGEKASLVLKDVGKPAVEPLISALSNKSQTIRERVVTILGEIADKTAVEPLLSLLLDEKEDEDFRGDYVAMALGKIGDTKAVEPLIKLASKHTEEIITVMSVRALGDIGDNRAIEPLIAILEDKETSSLCSHLILETCEALGKIRDIRAVEPLIAALRGDEIHKGYAADALGKIGDIRAVEPLIKVLENHREQEWVRDKAAWALVELDDDRIELPLLKYFKVKLDAIAKLKAPEHDDQWEVLEAVGRLIARLINKARIS